METNLYPPWIPLVSVLLECPAGSFINANNGGACELCEVDTYSTASNSDACSPCPSGTATRGETGRTSQDQCSESNLLQIQ